MHRNKCTLKFSSWKSKVPRLSEMVQLPAIILERKSYKNASIFFSLQTHFYVFFIPPIRTLCLPLPLCLSLPVFHCAPQFSGPVLAILMEWSTVLSLIGWEWYEGILQRGSKYQRHRDKMIEERDDNTILSATGDMEYSRCRCNNWTPWKIHYRQVKLSSVSFWCTHRTYVNLDLN